MNVAMMCLSSLLLFSLVAPFQQYRRRSPVIDAQACDPAHEQVERP
jgi:hypothetical protein